MIKFTSIRFGEEGITALYDGDGKLVTSGDYYHDKIDEFIDGYLECYNTHVSKAKLTSKSVEISFDKENDEWPYIDEAPKTLKEANSLVKKLKYLEYN